MKAHRTEVFWVILFPIAVLWALVTFLKRKVFDGKFAYASPLKIICVGNIHSGGSGKTPLVRLLAEKLNTYSPVILSRGYRGKLSAVGARVDLNSQQGAILYGDEPWMLARQTGKPVFVGKNRLTLIKEIERLIPNSLVLMDDGFQRLSVKKTVSLICINSDKSPGDNFCLPFGELREPLSAIAKSDAVVLTPGILPAGVSLWKQLLSKQFPKIPLFEAQLDLDGFYQGAKSITVSLNERIASFCGIAAPSRFIELLNSNLPVSNHLRSFPDHYQYHREDVDWLLSQGLKQEAKTFVTTDKDWFKVAPLFQGTDVTLVSLRYGYVMPDLFWKFLSDKMGEVAK
jgi:tetraacyldisaccharide 4'-kinase